MPLDVFIAQDLEIYVKVIGIYSPHKRGIRISDFPADIVARPGPERALAF